MLQTRFDIATPIESARLGLQLPLFISVSYALGALRELLVEAPAEPFFWTLK